jgi:hypothetical protein
VRALLLLAAALAAPAAAAPAINWSKARPIAIELRGTHFTPNRIVLRQGVAYRLTVHNATGQAHDLDSPPFFDNATVRAGDRATVATGAIPLAAGATRTVRLVPRQRGIFKFRSDKFGDSALGLTGVFQVN